MTPELNGKRVHAFELQMANLGFARMTEELLTMLKDGAWQEFTDGLGEYRFLTGEFDYFLSQRGVSRKDLMDLRDLDAKADLDKHMDERRTAEDGYRRTLREVRRSNPQRPGHPMESFGGDSRPALGDRVRKLALKGQRRKDSRRWQVQWPSDGSLAEVIAEKLLRDHDLAHEVYKLLDADESRRRYSQKRRSTAISAANGGRRAQRGN